MTDTKKAATRPVGNVRIQSDGSIVAESILSPESFVVGAEVWIPPRRVIPIVFLPGIMGSNLKVKPGSENTVRERLDGPTGSEIPTPWRPPNGKMDGWNEAQAWNKRNPRTRQALLSGDTTTVDDSGFLKASVSGLPLSDLTMLDDEEARFRGWGTVYWDSYGEFLLYLEHSLRGLTNPNLEQTASDWPLLLHAGEGKDSQVSGAFKVTKDDLKKMSKYWFPVYACGYNWINSNAESGQRVLDVIEKVIQVYTNLKGPSGKQLFECEKVILVTHSMGGLVGRWAAKNDTYKRILGVIHGVQPATGSPLAYRRSAAGTEPGGFVQNQFAKIIGRTQAETTPVMCNSAGALQLLPCKLYPKGWLQIERQSDDDMNVKTILALPKEDPYKEIYREKETWWRMVDPGLLDPAGRFIGKGADPWSAGYLRFLEKAESFHTQLGDYYLENKTYVSYGDDPEHRSFGTVHWRILINSGWKNRLKDDEILNAQLRLDQSESALSGHRPIAVLRPTGQISVDHQPLYAETAFLTANIQPPDVPGDGTVPWQSGEAPAKASAKGRTFALRGYDHQGAYGHHSPRRFTLWAIAKLISETT